MSPAPAPAAGAMPITFLQCGPSLFEPDWVHCDFYTDRGAFTVVTQGIVSCVFC